LYSSVPYPTVVAVFSRKVGNLVGNSAMLSSSLFHRARRAPDRRRRNEGQHRALSRSMYARPSTGVHNAPFVTSFRPRAERTVLMSMYTRAQADPRPGSIAWVTPDNGLGSISLERTLSQSIMGSSRANGKKPNPLIPIGDKRNIFKGKPGPYCTFCALHMPASNTLSVSLTPHHRFAWLADHSQSSG
jgi:hypothetical protein